MITTLAVSGYRSLRDLVVRLGPLNVVTGANGTGKSTLYRALRLLGEVAHGELIVALAREGGLPSLMVLNEPESSLHPDLLPALGRLIAQASHRSQIVVVTHATRLVGALEGEPDCNAVHLDKQSGRTMVTSAALETPRWSWPPR